MNIIIIIIAKNSIFQKKGRLTEKGGGGTNKVYLKKNVCTLHQITVIKVVPRYE